MHLHPPRHPTIRFVDNGASSVELVIAAPLLMTTILLSIQFAIWAHATQCAHAAAAEAAEAARLHDAVPAAGHARADHVLQQLATGVLTDAHVTVTRHPATTRVAVTGHAERVIPLPGLTMPVRIQVTAPTERWIPPGNP